jgi:UPF0755 protein
MEHPILIKILEQKNRLMLVLGLIFLISFLISTTPPQDFGSGKIITIDKGSTIKEVSVLLAEEKIIKSETFFNLFTVFSGAHVVEGSYIFHEKLNLFKVVKKISTGSYEIPVKRIVFYEGMSSKEISARLKDIFPDFDVETFLELATENEGYLFPDTYEFRQNVTPEEVIKEMRDNFDIQIEEIITQLEESEKTLEDIITMASIIEKEATRETMQEVSNVLWHRIEIGMALQVDAPFVYEINKGTFDLTLEDLATSSPYNTYQNTGLTPTPIGNPGIRSILAAAFPEKTSYLYFLTGQDGEMYFAKSFEGHKLNRARYLD